MIYKFSKLYVRIKLLIYFLHTVFSLSLCVISLKNYKILEDVNIISYRLFIKNSTLKK